ncbi:biotin-dependent carboxyltransferase family protein [Rhodoligotrophos ferricapiens]|uniref:5-oxoprolinase subunit C family protein n=1 Tax=Rhodoligotrophos ferricapiens TaxID=3069264 RepID=UPI00315C8F7B
MKDHLLIRDGGLFSTLQDKGRRGYQRYGISASGAMDLVSMAIANALVGNPPDTAVIEMTFVGLSAEVQADACRLSIGGGDVAVRINGQMAETFMALDLARGDVIEIGPIREGMRSYLAVHGGFDITPTLGSLSTHSRSGIGGLDGRALKAGDQLPLHTIRRPDAPRLNLPQRYRPEWNGPIRVVLGPQADLFTAQGIDTFLNSPYRISAKADRMGCHLEGPVIEHVGDFNIISDGITNGSIQVPGHGRPIILLADRQTTGGYPKIATIIKADLPRIAQRRPGDEVRFARVTIMEAVELARREQAWLGSLHRILEPALDEAQALTSERLLQANLISGVHAALSTTNLE